MGRYIQWNDVVGRYPDAPNLAQENNMGSYWLDYAEGEVDARLAVLYPVPFPTPAPYMVRDLSIDLTYYKMALRQESSKALWDYIENRFEALMNKEMILTTSGGALSGTDKAWTSNHYHTSFGPDDAINWNISSQWIQDVQTERGQP